MEEKSKDKPRNLWTSVDSTKYHFHVTISYYSSASEKVVYLKDLEKRKAAYGICGECDEIGTGEKWCRPCNSKRFEENFKNWTSGNKDIDEFIQQLQLNAVHSFKYIEWIPFENFQKVTYITRGGFGKIYSADWPEGNILNWEVENQEWKRESGREVALKSLNDSSSIGTDFLNEIKSHYQVCLYNIIQCYGITQDPNTNNYMMVLNFCKDGNLRNYLNSKPESELDYNSKIYELCSIARGLLSIHDSGKVHKDFHSGNILCNHGRMYISDLGMCQPANNEEKSKGIYGVLPYMAPEVLRGCQYTKASDVYSFGIIMNEFMSKEIPYNNIPHDHVLTVNICKGLRPKISDDTPKLLADLIIKCWDAKAEIRPTTKKLHEILKKWDDEKKDKNSEIYSQIKECEKIRENKLKIRKCENNESKKHPQAIYTSRLLNFKNLPEPENSSDLLSCQINSANLISECLDVQLGELDLKDLN